MTDRATLATDAVAHLTHQPVIGTAQGLQLLGEHGSTLDGVEVTAVHAAGRDLWVLADGRDLFRVANGAPELVASLADAATGTCVTSHGGDVWVGGDEAGLWRLHEARLDPVSSFQQAPSRDEWHTPWGGPPAVFSMASHGSDLYVGVHVGGILRSSDGGASWTPTIDLHDDVHQVTVDDSGTVWAATGARGLAASGDRGATWRYRSAGLHAHYLLAVTPTREGVLVGASSGHAAGDGAIYRFDGHRFERCGTGLPEELNGAVSPRCLAAVGDDAVAAVPGGDVYASVDGGRSWSLLADSLAGVSEVTLRAAA